MSYQIVNTVKKLHVTCEYVAAKDLCAEKMKAGCSATLDLS